MTCEVFKCCIHPIVLNVDVLTTKTLVQTEAISGESNRPLVATAERDGTKTGGMSQTRSCASFLFSHEGLQDHADRLALQRQFLEYKMETLKDVEDLTGLAPSRPSSALY